jgi:DNA modification methylase
VTDCVTIGPCTLYCGDCRSVMASISPSSVDSIVTDPPYGLSFMGKGWDHGVPGVEFWQAALRVAKPGAHLLAFGGTRTFHRLACAIEDADWEIRDCIMWVYGSGFPKSLDVSKAIDKEAGAEREVVGTKLGRPGMAKDGSNQRNGFDSAFGGNASGAMPSDITAPATDAARQWQGWGTALKPAWEPIIVARKPLAGTVAANVQQYGTGGINVDGCRVETDELKGKIYNNKGDALTWGGTYGKGTVEGNSIGRFPANLIHDGSEEVLAGFPLTKSQGHIPRSGAESRIDGWGMVVRQGQPENNAFGDSGSAARFFYCAKASRSERGEGNNHPTVKPLALMRYLVKLVTPPNGIVLDPFCGSGSTGLAITDGQQFVGIEQNPEYVAIAANRLRPAKKSQRELIPA